MPTSSQEETRLTEHSRHSIMLMTTLKRNIEARVPVLGALTVVVVDGLTVELELGEVAFETGDFSPVAEVAAVVEREEAANFV